MKKIINQYYKILNYDKQYTKRQAKKIWRKWCRSKIGFSDVFDKVTVYNDGTVERLYTE